MYGSCFDEGTLAARNNSIHLRTEPASHSFSDNLRDHVDEAYWPEIRDGFRTVLLWNEDDVPELGFDFRKSCLARSFVILVGPLPPPPFQPEWAP